jgi:type II secretory pathway pseudopilin PulG
MMTPVSDRGMSLIEVTIMLVVISILTGAMAPSVTRTVQQARLTRVTTDETAIKTAVTNFLTDTGLTGFAINGAGGGATPETLVSDGDIPVCTVPDSGCGSAVGSTTEWRNVVDNTGGLTDFLERHLVTNNPRGASGNAYAIAGWKGSYLNGPIRPDPWGNRYAVNVKWLRTNFSCAARTGGDVFVLSAGPDEQISTPYRFDWSSTAHAAACAAATALSTAGAFPSGDDIIAIIRRDGTGTVP